MSLIDAMLKSMMMKRVHDTDDETVAAEERIAGKTRNRPTYGVRRGTPAPDYSRHRQGAPEGRKKPERGATPNISSPRRVPTPKGVPPDGSGVSSWEEAELRHRRLRQEDEQDTWDMYRGLRPTYHYDPDYNPFGSPESQEYWSPDDDLAESIMDDKYDKTYGWYDPKQTMPDKKHPRGKWNYNPGADKEGPSQASAIDTLAGTGTVEDRPSVQGLEEPKGRGGKGRSAGPMTTLSMEKDAPIYESPKEKNFREMFGMQGPVLNRQPIATRWNPSGTIRDSGGYHTPKSIPTRENDASDYPKKPNIQNSAINKMLNTIFITKQRVFSDDDDDEILYGTPAERAEEHKQDAAMRHGAYAPHESAASKRAFNMRGTFGVHHQPNTREDEGGHHVRPEIAERLKMRGQNLPRYPDAEEMFQSPEHDTSDYVKKPDIQNSAIYKMLDRLFKADPNRIDAGRQRGAAVQQGIRDTALRGASEVSQGGGNEAQGIGQGIADSLGWAVAETVREGQKDPTKQAMSDAKKEGEQARLGQPPYKPWAQGQAGQGFGWMNWNQ